MNGIRLKLGAGFFFAKKLLGGLPDVHSLVHQQREDFQPFKACGVSDDDEAVGVFAYLKLVHSGQCVFCRKESRGLLDLQLGYRFFKVIGVGEKSHIHALNQGGV